MIKVSVLAVLSNITIPSPYRIRWMYRLALTFIGLITLIGLMVTNGLIVPPAYADSFQFKPHQSSPQSNNRPSSQSSFQSSYQTYVIHTYGGANLIPVVRQQLSSEGGGSVSIYQDKLVLRATAAGYRAVQQLLAQIDQAPMPLRVSVSVGSAREQSNTIQQGKIVISNNANNSNTTVNTNTVTSTKNRINMNAYGSVLNQSQAEQGSSLYQVNTLSGSPATIGTGRLLSLAQPYIATTYNRYGQPTGMITIGGQVLANSVQGIAVTPKLLPNNQIQIAIEQIQDRLNNTTTASIHRQQIATTLTLPRGQWVNVGTINQSEQRYQSGNEGSQSLSRSTSYPIQIKVD